MIHLNNQAIGYDLSSSSFKLNGFEEAQHFNSILQCVDTRKATGEDKLDPYFFKKICAPFISDELTYRFNISISSGVFPNIWKAAHVVPLHKGCDKADLNNY